MRQIYVYHTDGKILGYSARPDENFEGNEVVLIPLDKMRIFYDGKESIQSWEILNDKLQKKDEFIYDKSYVNDKFFEVTKPQKDANFRIVYFDNRVTIIDDSSSSVHVPFYFVKKDDPSILLNMILFEYSPTSLIIKENFSLYVADPSFTYSLELLDD